MSELKSRSFNCLNCQRSMQFDPTSRNTENNKKKLGDMEDGLKGQSVNLIKVICDAEVPCQAPICRECSDELMNDMDEQLASRDKECLAYKKLLEDLRSNFSITHVDNQKETLRLLKEEEQNYIREYKKLEVEEQRLEKEQKLLKDKQNEESEVEKKYWREFRDKHRRLLELTETTACVDAELRYTERQHNRLASTNILDLAFHIWVDSEGGTIPEINGHRIGRLPDKPVDWLEINAGFGQIVLLMDVLMQRANVKQDYYKLVTQGSHSCVKVKKPNGDLMMLPLYSSGSWKPFGNNNMDSGITALLGCFELLFNTLQTQDPNFRLQYKISKDRLVHQNVEYSAKMLLNSEERWTKAMKMFLANLKTAQVQVVAMRTKKKLMRNGERRYRRSRSSNSDSENEDHRRQTTLTLRRSFSEERNNKVSSTCLLTLSLLAALGTSSSLLKSTDLKKMDSYRNSEMMPSMDMPLAYKPRPQRLRYRDDLAMMKYSMQKNGQEYNAFSMQNEPMMMMPIVTERPRTNHLLPRPMMSPTTSAQSSNQQDPSLEDMELIDVLWRNDIASEKGQHPFAPSDQYERDLQLLTEKSIREPLTHSESARYEDLAKGYFEDFFFPVGCKNEYSRREVCTPTDEDLQTLLDDVSSGQLDALLEDRQVDQLCPNGLHEPHGPIINNVTLGQGIIFDANNVTELNNYEVPACSTITEGELFSNGTMDSPSWPQQTNMGPSDIFPAGPQEALFPMFPQNDTNVPIISTGIQYNHTYTSNTVSSHSDTYEGYYVPNGLSNYNESSSVCSSSTSSKSPSYLSEAENMPPVSRYYGKLAPNPSDIQLYSQEDVKDIKSVDDSDSISSAPRRRGRQSKDEQLAKMNNLPLTAKDIAEMSLADLQKMLKSENLTEMQKTLIKKIRRRGKNKVAARTCRQRRGDKSSKTDQDQWSTQLESQA